MLTKRERNRKAKVRKANQRAKLERHKIAKETGFRKKPDRGNELNTKPQRSTFVLYPLRELQRLADVTYGEGKMIVGSNTIPASDVVYMESAETGETVITIVDPEAKELLWAMLVEKRHILRGHVPRARKTHV